MDDRQNQPASYAALLRGINVGGKNMLPMPAFRLALGDSSQRSPGSAGILPAPRAIAT